MMSEVGDVLLGDGSHTPALAVITIIVLISIIGAATWRNAKGEGWGLVIFLASLIVGFNLSVGFAVLILEWIAGIFGGMGSWVNSAESVSQEFGVVAIIIVLFGTTYIMKKVEFDQIRIASLGTLYGILIRLFTDFLFWLVYSGSLG